MNQTESPPEDDLREVPPLTKNLESIKYTNTMVQHSLSRRRDIFSEDAVSEHDKSFVSRRKLTSLYQTLNNENIKRVLVEHKVSVQDTIFGIALHYDMNEKTLMDMNNLSSDIIYPGQTIMVLSKQVDMSSPRKSLFGGIDLGTLEDKNATIDICDFFTSKNGVSSLRFNCFYCTTVGEIKGCLTIKPNLIFFDPEIASDHNKKIVKDKKIIKYQVSLDYADVAGTAYVYNSETLTQEKPEFYLQIFLSSIGNFKYTTYVRKVRELKKAKGFLATIFFKFYDNADILRISDEVETILDLRNDDPNNISNLTTIPFYDIIYETKEAKVSEAQKVNLSCSANLDPKMKLDSLDLKTNLNSSAYLDSLPAKSRKKSLENQKSQDICFELTLSSSTKKNQSCMETISPEKRHEASLPRIIGAEGRILNSSILKEVVNVLPPVLRLRDWTLLFSPMRHGFCIDVFFKLCSNPDDAPTVLLIKDETGTVFGAFLSESWKKRNSFYGSGETFLFTFKNGSEISPFYWTRRNEHFIYSNTEDGLAVGTGEYYGIYINSDLTQGYTFPCDTFDNDFLSNKKDFIVDEMEVWNIQTDDDAWFRK